MTGLVATGGGGVAVITTSIRALAPSQVPVVWLTHQLVVPGVEVEGTGAVGDPEPPEEAVYHKRLFPDALNAVAVVPWQ